MAKFIARRDAETHEVYIKAADNFPVPKAVFDVLGDHNGPFFGDWSKIERTFRFELQRGSEAVRWLRDQGHLVATIEGRPRGPVECAACGRPYRSLHTVEPGETCQNCGAELVLVPPPT